MFHSGFLEFKLDYSETKDLAIGQFVSSDSFYVGEHKWRMLCYPRGDKNEHKGDYVSIFLVLVSNPGVKAVFDAFLLNRDGTPSLVKAKRSMLDFKPNIPLGWSRFVKRSDLELTYMTNGLVRFMCGVIDVSKNPMPMTVPPPDIGTHLGNFLDSAIGSDVSFVVNGEEFPAHRAVVAARSPFFKAELFGAMADATMPSSITVQDIEPAAFKVMLRFMYTDSFPADSELGDSLVDMLQHLLAAADRFALDRLKLICSLKLIENISVNSVGSILVCAETYNCPELKIKCLDFFAVENNFKEAAFTDGFTTLVQKFPSLAAELRRRVVNF